MTIFGILNIGFGMLELLIWLVSLFMSSPQKAIPLNTSGKSATNSSGDIVASSMSAVIAITSAPSYAAYEKFEHAFGIIEDFALIAAGAGLLMVRNWARILSMIYAGIEIIEVVAGALLLLIVPGPVFIKVCMAAASVLFGTIYPILLLIFMTRPKVVAACNPAPPMP